MTKYIKASEGKYNRIKSILKFVRALKVNPTVKNVVRASDLAKALLKDLDDSSIYEEPTTRLFPAKGLYFCIVRDVPNGACFRTEFADDKVRLPIFRDMRDLIISMERNGWKEEDGYRPERIDLIKYKSYRFQKAILGRYKEAANEDTSDISGDQ